MNSADREPPITLLEVDNFITQLTENEAKYAHFMSKASHAGTRVVLRQVSDESEAILDLILSIHKKLSGKYPNPTSDETVAYLEYASQFLANLGNYKAFGDSKFIPRCLATVWQQMIEKAGLPYQDYESLLDSIYRVTEKSMLGYPAEGYTSSYYLGEPVSKDDMKIVKKLFAQYAILPENTRIKKVDKLNFIILVSSADLANEIDYPKNTITIDNVVFKFQFGDHSREMGKIVNYLKEAQKYAANEIQKEMLQNYITHFQTGSSQAHKESQKLWVKDVSPTVETNIGFIETYREPSGIIGEFESLVSIQNKERTMKFKKMVDNAKEFISLLPWTSDWEKPVFNPPDFTSLEVLTFCSSGIPAGINIPNYDDVRLNIGFKNVSLGNILSASTKKSNKYPPSFIEETDRPLFEKYQGESFEVQVGIHELLGHGSGKLMCEIDDGKFNFDKLNPPKGLDNQPITTYYKLGETWGSMYGSIAGSMEETRAELVAMYLITNRKLLKIFGYNSKQEQDDIIYVGYLQMVRAGLLALEYWDPATGKWGQAHMQARFSIMKTFLLHCVDKDFLTFEPFETKNGKEMNIKLDRTKIENVGHDAVADYLLHLHIFKCSGDVVNGTKYFEDRCSVPKELAQYRDLVISKRLPRRQFIQPNTVFDENNSKNQVTVKGYEETAIGMIQSFIDRDI